MARTSKCLPGRETHYWNYPSVGDEQLVCRACNKKQELDVYALAELILGSIIGARHKYYKDGDRFERAVRKAYETLNSI